MNSIFEIIMLLCFGAAWPLSIIRSARSKSTKGKSFLFLVVIFAGYISGILYKVFYRMDYVLILYALNAVMVGTDIALYLRNRKIERGLQTQDCSLEHTD